MQRDNKEPKIADYKSKITDLENKVNNLETQVLAVKKAHITDSEHWKNEKNEHETECDQLKKQVQLKQNEIKTLEKENENLKDRLKTLYQENELKSKRESLHAQIINGPPYLKTLFKFSTAPLVGLCAGATAIVSAYPILEIGYNGTLSFDTLKASIDLFYKISPANFIIGLWAAMGSEVSGFRSSWAFSSFAGLCFTGTYFLIEKNFIPYIFPISFVAAAGFSSVHTEMGYPNWLKFFTSEPEKTASPAPLIGLPKPK